MNMNTSDTLRLKLESAQNDFRRNRLKSMQRVAVAFLLGAMLLYVIGQVFSGRHPAWAYVTAFAEAAMVGAVADWFAVVALFRHPMGIPVWHTAIIPRNKDDIAKNLGAFIVTHFVTADGIVGKVREFNPARKLAAWLLQAANGASLGRLLAEAASAMLIAMDDARMRAFVRVSVKQKLGSLDVSSAAGDLLDTLVSEQRHQEVLDAVLVSVSEKLEEPDTHPKITALVNDALAVDQIEFMGMKIGGTLRALTGPAVTRLVVFLKKKSAEIQADPEHPWRERFDGYARDFILRLKADPEWRGKIESVKTRLLADARLDGYLEGLWDDTKARMLDDIKRQDSVLAGHLGDLAVQLGNKLAADRALNTWVNERILAEIPPMVEKHRDGIAQFITQQIQQWSKDEMTERFELAIGRDLQFIRINGTLIGGLAGLIIYTVTLFLKG